MTMSAIFRLRFFSAEGRAIPVGFPPLHEIPGALRSSVRSRVLLSAVILAIGRPWALTMTSSPQAAVRMCSLSLDLSSRMLAFIGDYKLRVWSHSSRRQADASNRCLAARVVLASNGIEDANRR